MPNELAASWGIEFLFAKWCNENPDLERPRIHYIHREEAKAPSMACMYPFACLLFFAPFPPCSGPGVNHDDPVFARRKILTDGRFFSLGWGKRHDGMGGCINLLRRGILTMNLIWVMTDYQASLPPTPIPAPGVKVNSASID